MGRQQVLSDNKKDWFTLLLLIIAILGIFWGAVVGAEAGVLYLTIISVAFLLISFATLFNNESNKKQLNQLFKTPFSGDAEVSMMAWVFGWISIIVINVVGSFTQSFSTTQFFSSLYLSGSNTISSISQSFSAGIVENTPLGTWFYSVFVAGTIEEFTWAFALVLIFYTIGLGMVETFWKGKNPMGIDKRNFVMGFAIIMAMVTFGFIHKLNGSYIGIMFIIAMGFRLIINSLIYILGFILSFAIGMHQSNNNLAYIQQFGFATFIEALFGSIYGWIFAVLLIGVFVYILIPRNFTRIWIKFKKTISGYKF
jgi:hypothetical protein